MDKASRIVTITGAFVETKNGWANQVSIELAGMRNPVNNKAGSGFVIRTYEDKNQIYSMDKLDALQMKPTLECPAPFIRIKNRIKDKEYQTLCHIVRELETYMLTARKLPTDFKSPAKAPFEKPKPVKPKEKGFTGFGAKIKSKLIDIMNNQEPELEPLDRIPTGLGSQMRDMNLEARLIRLEMNQAKAITDLNNAVATSQITMKKALTEMDTKKTKAMNKMQNLLDTIV